MQKRILLLCLFLLTYCNPKNVGQQLLDKTIAYHDPQSNWSKLKTRLYLSNIDTAGKEALFEVEIDNATGYFCHITREGGKEIAKGISAGKEFFLVDGMLEISDAERQKYELTPGSAKSSQRFYGYLYGLPMKLKDPGANVSDAVLSQQFNGKSYQTIRVNYDPEVGKEVWTFYLDPTTNAMEGYSFLFGSDTDEGEYIILEDLLNVEGINIPKVRKWYLLKGNKYLGTDSLLKSEPLVAYRM